jgi:hypothetical protein
MAARKTKQRSNDNNLAMSSSQTPLERSISIYGNLQLLCEEEKEEVSRRRGLRGDLISL